MSKRYEINASAIEQRRSERTSDLRTEKIARQTIVSTTVFASIRLRRRANEPFSLPFVAEFALAMVEEEMATNAENRRVSNVDLPAKIDATTLLRLVNESASNGSDGVGRLRARRTFEFCQVKIPRRSP